MPASVDQKKDRTIFLRPHVWTRTALALHQKGQNLMTQACSPGRQRGLEQHTNYCSTSWLEAYPVPLRPFPA